eukprot:TRINITY_DN2565_c0_g2::TRINITY_DN2565_c0_g2_i1::g.19305::m.19305 TRINITY_DN2565_c0_g2::TRINITY_DN2565_c0_g2_i1::g.19305  ORF type:complete len:102 (-),score=2.72 TRINITY_DN2565_c0_g2_i1:354-659(-)
MPILDACTHFVSRDLARMALDYNEATLTDLTGFHGICERRTGITDLELVFILMVVGRHVSDLWGLQVTAGSKRGRDLKLEWNRSSLMNGQVHDKNKNTRQI